MMDVIAELRRLCEFYPVLFYIKIILAILCVFPSLLLLFAVLRSSIHSNCRIMLCLWGVSQLVVYSTVCWLSIHFILFETEFFSQDFDPKSMRKYIVGWYGTSWYASTCFELGIGLERGLSIRNPALYHHSKTAAGSISLYFASSLALSCLISKLIISDATATRAMGALLSNSLDIAAIVINFLVVFYAGRKDRTSEKRLNQRYQIREAYNIVRAMVPVYFLGTAIKVSIIIVNWIYVAHMVPYSVCEVLTELSCGLTSGLFLMYHVRLRSKLVGISVRFSKRFEYLTIEKDSGSTTENYFRQLTESWER